MRFVIYEDRNLDRYIHSFRRCVVRSTTVINGIVQEVSRDAVRIYQITLTGSTIESVLYELL